MGQFGAGSVVATSALSSGAFDADVAVLSALRLLDQGLPARLIGEAVLAAIGVNALGRPAVAIPAGPVAFWLPLVAAAACAFAAGLATFLLLR